MRSREKALVFPCAGENLVGILTQPEVRAGVGVVLVVGGPQYRAGSHRLFVALARSLAAGGFPVLRFDYRGMGDSSGEPRDFEAVAADICAAVEALAGACPGLHRVVLAGLCDGASAALLYLDGTRDERIGGLVLINPWVRSEASLARTQVRHYYGRRLLERAFWLKLLRGELAVAASCRDFLRALGKSLVRQEAGAVPAAAPFQDRMARAWRAFPGPILVLLSDEDYVAREFLEHAGVDPAWAGLLAQEAVGIVRLAGADHTFSLPEARRRLADEVLVWLEKDGRSARRVA